VRAHPRSHPPWATRTPEPHGVSRSHAGSDAATSPSISASPMGPRAWRSARHPSCSRRSKHTTERSGRKTHKSLRITLGVHPWFGQEVVVLGPFGEGIWGELPDGRTCYLPLSWTDWRPRPDPLALRGQPVRLAPEALRSLAAWIRGRAEVRKVDTAESRKLDMRDLEDQKRSYGDGDQARARAASAAVVGKAGASGAGRARTRRRKQQRGKR
jgi:hypothetical protein